MDGLLTTAGRPLGGSYLSLPGNNRERSARRSVFIFLLPRFLPGHDRRAAHVCFHFLPPGASLQEMGSQLSSRFEESEIPAEINLDDMCRMPESERAVELPFE